MREIVDAATPERRLRSMRVILRSARMSAMATAAPSALCSSVCGLAPRTLRFCFKQTSAVCLLGSGEGDHSRGSEYRVLCRRRNDFAFRSEEHTSELQSLMRISYHV